ncbi:hypothetical protein [Pontibacter liquoris]|uniref:hypothetical protein n=1 Tax=Pontibacter liquoris TaxID=2905677 RepID=UPI001FA77D3F|nr:hypothetical protein [Pontibacter liquoris]
MRLKEPFYAQRTALYGVTFLYLLALLILAAIALQPYVKVSDLTRDAIVIAKGRIYYGLLSNIGILLWCAAASCCLFSAWLLNVANIKRNRLFLFCAGLLSAILLFDDFFMLHELVIPKLFGIKEIYVVATYPLLILAFLLYFRNAILNTSYLVLLTSLGFLGLSVVIDAILPDSGQLEFLLEDGFKFMGIAGWGFYLTTTSAVALWQCMYTQEAPAPVIEYERVMEVVS